MVLSASSQDNQITFQLLKPDDVLTIDGTIRLESAAPEFVVELSAQGEMRQLLSFPLPFETHPGQFLILPVNEGISYPVDDATLPPMCITCSAVTGCAWGWGTDRRPACWRSSRRRTTRASACRDADGVLCLQPEWVPQKGQFGPERRLRYVFFDEAATSRCANAIASTPSRPACCKTLAEKRRKSPPSICWSARQRLVLGPGSGAHLPRPAGGRHRADLVEQPGSPERVAATERAGRADQPLRYLPGCDEPGELAPIAAVHPDWTSDAWPHDLVLDANGDWERGWDV